MRFDMARALPLALGFLALVAGCEDKPAPAPASSAPAKTAAASAVAATAATASAAATAAPAGDPGMKGAFHTVAEGTRIVIYPVGDAGIVDTGAFYAVLGDGPIEQDPLLFRSTLDRDGKTVMTEIEPIDGFFGAWPGQAWGKRSDGTVKRTGDFWVKTDPLRDNERLLDIAPLDQKRALAAIRMEAADIRFTLTGSSAGGVIPAPGKPTAAQEGCAVRMDPDAALKLGGLPSGHMFAVGRECKTGKAIAERWQPGKARGEVDVIDGVSGAPIAVAAASPDEAYALFPEGFLATWDGKAWKSEKAPFGAGKSVWVSGDGVAWGLGEGGLYKHPKGGAWTKVDTGSAPITSAWAKDEKTIWAVASGKTLLRNGPAEGPPLVLPSADEVAVLLTRDRRWLATPVCKRTFVMLSLLTDGKVPAAYGPLTDAVKGNAELTAKEVQYLVEDVGGALWVSAKVPSPAVAQRLIAAYTTKIKASPRVYCHEPLIVKGALKVE
jgi:hypothetical protein